MPLGLFVVILIWWNLKKTKKGPFLYTCRSVKKQSGYPALHGFFDLNHNRRKDSYKPWFTGTNFRKGTSKIYQRLYRALLSEQNSLFYLSGGHPIHVEGTAKL